MFEYNVILAIFRQAQIDLNNHTYDPEIGMTIAEEAREFLNGSPACLFWRSLLDWQDNTHYYSEQEIEHDDDNDWQ